MNNFTELTDAERIERIEKLNLNYPRLMEILKKIEYCHKSSARSTEPTSMLITGIQGVGKTTLYKTYQQAYPRREVENKTIVPILSAVIPAPATVKGLVTELLLKLGDPIAEKGTVVSQTVRLRHLLNECETEGIILDEFQHVIDRDSTKVLRTTADWLKNLLSNTGISIILIGMPSCQMILEDNPQLRRRFSIRKELTPIKWTAPGAADNEIQTLLQVIDYSLLLKKNSNLSDPQMAYRIYCATDGLMNGIMKLVRGGNRIAVESGIEQIDLEILDQVYEEVLASSNPTIPNPFRQKFSDVKPMDLYE